MNNVTVCEKKQLVILFIEKAFYRINIYNRNSLYGMQFHYQSTYVHYPKSTKTFSFNNTGR